MKVRGYTSFRCPQGYTQCEEGPFPIFRGPASPEVTIIVMLPQAGGGRPGTRPVLLDARTRPSARVALSSPRVAILPQRADKRRGKGHRHGSGEMGGKLQCLWRMHDSADELVLSF